jgi:hypothetical protein
MRIEPRWWIGVVVFLAYSAWVTAVWVWRGVGGIGMFIGGEAERPLLAGSGYRADSVATRCMP